MSRRASAVIAGAGVAGVATAWQLSLRAGGSEVVLVDPREPLSLTSNRSGENYRDWWPERPKADLVRRSLELMAGLRRDGAGFALNRRGYLYVTTDPATAQALPELMERYRDAAAGDIRVHGPGDDPAAHPPAGDPDGFDPTGPTGADVLLDPQRVRQIYPYLTPDLAGAVHTRTAGSFDGQAFGRAMVAAAQARGVTLVRGRVVDVGVREGSVTGVVVEAEGERTTYATEWFVDAAGPFTGPVAGLAGADLQIQVVLQQRLILEDPAGVIPRSAPFTVSLDPDPTASPLMDGPMPPGLVMRPWNRPGEVLLAWAYNDRPMAPTEDPPLPSVFPTEIVRCAIRLFPGLAAYAGDGLRIVSHVGGQYVETPDHLPIVGPIGPAGAFVAGGLAGFGFMTCAAVGELAAAWVTGADLPGYASAFRPDRFTPEYLAALAHGPAYSAAL